MRRQKVHFYTKRAVCFCAFARKRFFMAGDEGFEPPITGPEPAALPLGQSPMRI